MSALERSPRNRYRTLPITICAGLATAALAVEFDNDLRYRDYLRFAASTEKDLVHASGHVTRISDPIPYLEVQLDSGRWILSTL